MSCCGQRRQALATTGSNNPSQRNVAMSPQPPPLIARPSTSFAETPARGARPASVAAPAASGSHSLRYLARAPVIVRGPASGAEYRFSAAQPVQRVARADVDALLRTGHFERLS